MVGGPGAEDGHDGPGATAVSADPSRQLTQCTSWIDSFGEAAVSRFGAESISGEVSDARLTLRRVVADENWAVQQEDMVLTALADSLWRQGSG